MNDTRMDVAFEVVNGEVDCRLLITCDHASRHIPTEYAALGVEESLLHRHIAWDIGAGDVSRRLAALLDCPAILCGTSRLLIDCNRQFDDPTLIPPVSDGVEVPGNQAIGETERADRIRRWFRPYHAEIERRIVAHRAQGRLPAMIAIHSFTPVMDGIERPWQAGLLFRGDERLARPLLDELRRDPNLVVGENQPYSGFDPSGYGLMRYGDDQGLAMVLIEIRQDLIDTHQGAEAWAHRLAGAFRPLLDDDNLYRLTG